MTNNLVMCAQALDNTSPDHILFDGVLLAPEETIMRQDAATTVSSVMKSGKKIFDQSGVRLTINKKCLVLEVATIERDVVGRGAPILYCGEYDVSSDENYADKVMESIVGFAKQIGRTVAQEQYDVVKESFKLLKKKSHPIRIIRTALIIMVVLILITMAYKMTHPEGL